MCEALDLIMYGGCTTRVEYFFVSGSNSSVSNIVHNCVIEKDGILWNYANTVSETIERDTLLAFSMRIDALAH